MHAHVAYQALQAGQEFAREHGFYMQKYCGCVFSEEDRYLAKKRKKEAERLAAARQNGPD